MATFKNKRKLAAVPRETPGNTRNSQSQNTLDPEMAQEYISQVSEKIEGRVTKRFSKEFNQTESRILGALSKLDEFFLNPQVRTCSVAVRGSSRNSDLENQEPNGDRSQNDPYPKVMCSSHHFGILTFSEQEEGPHMVTGVQEEFRNRHHLETAVQEDNPYCSPGTSSGKHKKARSTNQAQFRGENTPATIEPDHILLALQQLATNSNSANFNKNTSRISQLPKSFTTRMPTFDGEIGDFQTV